MTTSDQMSVRCGITDRDLAPIARTEANYWRAEYFRLLRDLRAAHRGIARLKRRLARKEGAQQWK